LSKFVRINPEGITQGYPYQTIAYIDISSVGSGQLVEQPEEILLKDAPSRAKRIVRNKDIILATVRPNLRSFLFIKNPNDNTVVSTGFAVLRTKALADPRFIYYAITDRSFTGYLTNNTKGTSYPAVDSDIVLRGDIPDFDFKRQQYIGEILSAYDNLIDTNRRRIQLLEEAARLLFREWFVYFKFPHSTSSGQAGNEKVKIVDGVPEGWEKVPISSLCSVHRGASPRPINNFLGGTIPWFKIGDATASESPFVIETKEAVIESGAARSVLLTSEELILSNSATCGVPNFTGIQGCIHDGWLYFHDLKRVDKWFLYCFLNEKQKELLQGISEGSTQKNFNTSYVGSQLVLLPKKSDLLLIFCQLVEPIFKQIFHLAKYNKTLKEARDLLLPRLMSGAIDPVRYDKLSNGVEV